MTKVRRFCCAMIALAAMMLSTAGARAQTLPLLPSESLVVIKIKNLQDVSNKVAALAKDWGLDQMRPELADPLGSVQAMSGLGAGIDKAGEVAIALLDGGPNQRDPEVLALVPISDYKAFTASLPNAVAEGAVTAFKPGGKPVYAADWGKYAAISPNKTLVSAKGQGVVAPAASSKELASKDVIVFANLKLIRKDLLPQLQQNKAQILQQMSKGFQQMPNPQMAAAMQAYMGQILNSAEQFLTDADGATFGLGLSPQGISTTLLADFAPDSYLGKAFAGAQNVNATFTEGLPAGKYLFYGGFAMGPSGNKLMTDFIAPIEKALAGQDKESAAYIGAMKDYMAASTQWNFGLLAPSMAGMGNGEGVINGVSVVSGDTTKLLASTKVMMENASGMMAASGAGSMKMEFTPGAKNVGGVALDKFGTKMGEPQTPQEQQIAMMMQMMYGKGGPTGYGGKVAADRVVQIIGNNEQLITDSVKAAAANADALSTGVAAPVAANLPKQKIGAFYVSVDAIGQLVLDVMAMRGLPGGVKIPPNLPPIGGSVASEGPAVRVDGYIPSPLVKSLVAAGLQIYLQQMPGGAKGGGL